MDERLSHRLNKWHEAIDKLSESEKEFLSLEANEKPMFSKLFLESQGKTVAEREAHTYTCGEWRKFQLGLVEAKVNYLAHKRELELKQAAFNAEYLQCKVEGEAIQRTPKGF
jgi:hypothetical protein